MRYFIVKGRRIVSFSERVQDHGPEGAAARFAGAGLLELRVHECDSVWDSVQDSAQVVVMGDTATFPRDLAAAMSMTHGELGTTKDHLESARRRNAELLNELEEARARVAQLERELAARPSPSAGLPD